MVYEISIKACCDHCQLCVSRHPNLLGIVANKIFVKKNYLDDIYEIKDAAQICPLNAIVIKKVKR